MPPNSQKTCTRTNCGKKLRPTNETGMCATGCLSEEAPPAKRANAEGADQDVLARFRRVAKALGKDPDEILDGAMRTVAAKWLEAVEAAVR